MYVCVFVCLFVCLLSSFWGDGGGGGGHYYVFRPTPPVCKRKEKIHALMLTTHLLPAGAHKVNRQYNVYRRGRERGDGEGGRERGGGGWRKKQNQHRRFALRMRSCNYYELCFVVWRY